MDKFQIFNKLLKEMYANKVDTKITLKGLIAILDEVEEIHNKQIEEAKNNFYIKIPFGEEK